MAIALKDVIAGGSGDKMMCDLPLVSVIVATYNMGQYLVQAIDSILNQEYSALQVIVVDDGSVDDTVNVLERYKNDSRVRIIRQQNAGQTVAKNRGLQEAEGEFIAFCDADNYWLPDKLTRQFALMDTLQTQGVVYGDIQCIDAEGKPLQIPQMRRHSGRITGHLLRDNFVAFNTVLISKKIIDEIGGFDPSLRMGIDYDLWLRVSVKYDFFHIPEPLVAYRIWGGQMSNRKAERFENSFKLLKQFLSKYPKSVTWSEVRRGWAHIHVSRGRWRATQGNYMRATMDFMRAFLYRPNDYRLWKTMVKLLMRT